MSFLFVDRILELSPGKSVRGIKQVTSDDFYLTQSDDGRFCFIPSLIGETLGQLAAWNVMLSNDFTMRPVAGIVGKALLKRPVFVGETLLLESIIDSLDENAVRYHSRASVGSEEVFCVEDALGPLLPMSDFIGNDEIRLQFSQIYRPGDWEEASRADEQINFLDSSLTLNANMHMNFDRIVEFNAAESLVAEKLVNSAAPYFSDHFPKKPVLPMTVLLQCKLNLAKAFIRHSKLNSGFDVQALRRVKMNEFVQPGDKVTTHLRVKSSSQEALILSFRSEVDGKRVCVLEMVLALKDIP